MENKKIYFISSGTGGAEIMNVLNDNFNLYGINHFEITNIAISKFAKDKLNSSIFIEKNNIFEFIEKTHPNFVINECSNDLEMQNKITKFCKENKIPIICILDLYGNYKKRFSSIPNYILVPSYKIKKELIKDINIPYSNIFITGNPSFDRISNINYIKPNNNKVLFVSQPLYEMNIGNQYKVFKKFYDTIKQYAKSNINFIIKTHPREPDTTWIKKIGKTTNIQLFNGNDTNDFLLSCINYDLIIGYNSTLLLQCYYANIPQISYCNNYKSNLQLYFSNKYINQTYYDDFKPNAIKNTISVIEKIIAQNANFH